MSRFQPSVCPHDCPSTCALDVEVLDDRHIGRVRGNQQHSYTAGVICAKVARYAERTHHPERLMTPLRRVGPKGSGLDGFAAITWETALDEIVSRWQSIIQADGAEALWPFHYAGTMGLVQRDGLDRLRHALGSSRQHSTYCVALSDAGWQAGAGVKRGADVRLMRHSDLVVIWGGNPVSTQVNVMHHLAQARRHSNARLVVIDPYRTRTAQKADLHLALRPGTDGALACAVMHWLLAHGHADQDYLANYTDWSDGVARHLHARDAHWAAPITGLSVSQIEQFAALYGQAERPFLRLGYGFSRSRNGAVNMHAASCLPALTGAWRQPGGGALYGNSAIYPLDRTLIKGDDIPHAHARVFDQSRIGAVLCGEPAELQGGPPVKALFVQNTNPAVVAPDTRKVLEGLARDDLFTVVHEHFLTDTARHADIVLPATQFVEHDDLYTASGHTHLQVARALIEAPGQCRSNHWLVCALAQRLGLEHAGFKLDAWTMIDRTLQSSGLPGADALFAAGGIDLAPEFESANFLDGFGHADKRFRFCPDWAAHGPNSQGMPALPDHWAVTDAATDEHPLRLVAAPARQFMNSTFTETASACHREKRPCARMHPDDLQRFGLSDGEPAILGNRQGEVTLHAQAFTGLQPGTVVVESQWPNLAFPGGLGINTLVSAEPAQPNGGAVYHDTAVWVRRARV